MSNSQTSPWTDAGPEPVAVGLAVMLVGREPSALQALASQVRSSLPHACIEMLSSTTELVFRLARSGVGIVLIDSANASSLPPSLSQLPLSRSYRLRLAFVGASTQREPAVALHQLPAWLHAAAAGMKP